VLYSHANVGSDKKTRSSVLNNAKVEKINMTCSGVNFCEYLASDIKAMEHTQVTPEMLEVIRERRLQNGAQSGVADANRLVMYCKCMVNLLLIHYSFYLAERKKFLQKKACRDIRESCTWKFVQEASEVKICHCDTIFIIYC